MPVPRIPALALWLCLAMAAPAVAHEGEDHGAELREVDTTIAPRFDAQGDGIELVGVLAGDRLVIYLDRLADNAPIDQARIEIETASDRRVARPVGGGAYVLSAGALSAPGRHLLKLTVETDELLDLLSATLHTSASGANGRATMPAIPAIPATAGATARSARPGATTAPGLLGGRLSWSAAVTAGAVLLAGGALLMAALRAQRRT